MKNINIVNLISLEDGVEFQLDTWSGWKNLMISKLEKCINSNTNDGLTLIYTQDIRNIGKSTCLVEFAKKHKYSIAINTSFYHENSEQLKKQAIRVNISGSLVIINFGSKNLLVDECIDINDYRLRDYNILTGFTEKKTIKTNDDKNFNSSVVNFLKLEEDLLREKANLMLQQHDFSMYTKLINAYENVISLINKYDWQTKYSEYTVDGIKHVSVWEQNHQMDIRNHKVWEVTPKKYSLNVVMDNITGNWENLSDEIKERICKELSGVNKL